MSLSFLGLSVGSLQRAVRHGLVLVVLFLLVPRLNAGDLTELQVTETGGVYYIKMVMQVQAPVKYVRGVLTDYAHIYRLNPSIVESEILPSPAPGVVRVRTLMVGCVAFFCRHIGRVEDVRELPGGDLQAEIVPALGDLKSGAAEWKIRRRGEQTQVTYQANMEPGFFIPPLIGSYFVRRNIRKEIMTSFKRLECIAKTQASIDSVSHLQLASLGIDSVCNSQCNASIEDCQ
jgi:hypothetical protein